MAGFIKNVGLVREDFRVEDHLGFKSLKEGFCKFLTTVAKHSIIGLIGAYGSGKSTMLYQVSQDSKDSWIFFDAWSYPNRKDLWENFVISFAKQTSPKEYRKVMEKISGTTKNPLRQLLSVGALAANMKLPGAGSAIEKFSYFIHSSPVTRIDGFKELLLNLIRDKDSDIFVVLEDIDRCANEGAVFLETLRQFVNEDLVGLERSVVFIIPMRKEDVSHTTYEKLLDYSYPFSPKNIDFTEYIEAAFDESLIIKNQKNWKSHINYLLKTFLDKKSLRDLKKIIREANSRFSLLQSIENFKPDFRIVLMLKVYEYFEKGISKLKVDDRGFEIYPALEKEKFSTLLCQAVHDDADIFKLNERLSDTSLAHYADVVFVQNHNFCTPERIRDPFIEANILCLSDLYIS